MAAGFSGMNVEAVEGLARQLKGKSGEIDSLVAQIGRIVDDLQVQWKGSDASQFKGWWDSQHRPAMQKLSQDIAGLSQSALNNASEQRSVSGR